MLHYSQCACRFNFLVLIADLIDSSISLIIVVDYFWDCVDFIFV